MKIMILAIGRSGTTALLHRVGSGLPEAQIFSGGKPDKAVGFKGNGVFKFTYNEPKGRTFDMFRDHLRQTEYDRKIWIARDPRDNALSRFLFRWYRGSKSDRDQYRAVINLIEKKEQNPPSVSFQELMRYRGQKLPPFTTSAEVGEDERRTFEQIHGFVSSLGDDWCIFKYEDLVDNNFTELNNYLGFEIKAETNIDRATLKVARKKSTGDWRHWFTEEDVQLFRPAYNPYMDLIGYDSKNWDLHAKQVIEPEYASLYLKGLPRRRQLDSLQRFKKKISRFFTNDAE